MAAALANGSQQRHQGNGEEGGDGLKYVAAQYGATAAGNPFAGAYGGGGSGDFDECLAPVLALGTSNRLARVVDRRGWCPGSWR